MADVLAQVVRRGTDATLFVGARIECGRVGVVDRWQLPVVTGEHDPAAIGAQREPHQVGQHSSLAELDLGRLVGIPFGVADERRLVDDVEQRLHRRFAAPEDGDREEAIGIVLALWHDPEVFGE